MKNWFAFLCHSKEKQKPVEELLQRAHTHEIYHVQNALPGQTYPLAEAEIVRLLHSARYGDYRTRNSIHLRLRQAMLPDLEERDVDQEQCELDDLYVAWSQSFKRPTPVLAQELYRLMQRETKGGGKRDG